MSQTYYDILGVSPTATPNEIKAAYRKLAFEFHPDRNPNKEIADTKMKELNFVYSVLSDPQQRKWYDESIEVTDEFEKTEEDFDSYNYSSIFCNEIEIEDSTGRTSNVAVGQTIYYLVEIDKSIITWKYKSKEYFHLTIKKIFDPSEKENFGKKLKYDLKKTPLFLVHFGERDMIIYREDYQSYWFSQASFTKMDRKKGILTAIVLLILLSFGFYHFFNKFSVTDEQKTLIKFALENKLSISEEDIEFLKDEYSVSSNELSYIDSDYYIVCSKERTTTLESVELSSIPDRYGIDVGSVPEGEEVEILLNCPERNAYKVRYKDLVGWLPGRYLNNPQCENIFALNDEE